MRRLRPLPHIRILSTLFVVSAVGLAHPASDAPASAAARVQPRDESRTIAINPDTGAMFVPGETSTARTIYAVVGFCCTVVLALFLGFRAKTLKNNALRKCNFTSILVLLLYFFGLGFILSTSIVESGQGLSTHKLCYSSAMICLVFYTGNKLTIYLFLLERARIVRSPFMPRHRDYLWLPGIIIIVGGFGTIAIIGYLSPIVELSALDGRCRIGLPSQVSFPLLSFDVGVNILLTGVFLWLLRPVLSFHGLGTLGGVCGNRVTRAVKRSLGRTSELESGSRSSSSNDGNTAVFEGEDERLTRAINRNIKTLLWKSLIGSCAIMLPTVANMAQFYIMQGRELGWICLTICTLDVSWGIIVINWLTIGSAEAESNLTTLMSQRTITTAEEPLGLRTASRSRQGSVMTAVEAPPYIQRPGAVYGGQRETGKSVEDVVRPVRGV
ncbi:hypothetical protein K505DRAFT_286769 [Melanomma pulvis-pyrius CBS 109.77]|uniref:G-protein coupled receptors family 2 profile 2 domain-containing protein n=1 Tax=Melanomma pulvis-pyrius CBS 109.77 TaxID=1314802 RepID=A0A6A6WVE0_9PLEO|nr:hypothetical protein K505DRAFT_286769 [Melanomma pulvis-pyrius CBS 109.77]